MNQAPLPPQDVESDPMDSFSVSPEERQLFGTYRILVPQGTRESWDAFRSRPFREVMDEILPEKVSTVALVIFRRHPEHCAYFLSLFDNACNSRHSSILYVPFLCHRIAQIPVQWIVRHVTRFSDVRFSHQIVKEAFSSLHNSSRPFEEAQERKRVWTEYMEITKQTENESERQAWKQMIEMRAAIRDLLDYKIDISLVEYMRLDKGEFVRRMIAKCTTPARLRSLLKMQLVPFCEAHAVNFVPFLISDAVNKDWGVQQKLELVQEFITLNQDIKQALDAMTYEGDEVEKIQAFANRHEVSYVPDQKNNVKRAKPLPPMVRSCSIQSIRGPVVGSARELAQTTREPGMPRRSPSIDLSNVSRPVEAGSITSICDGQPDDPVEYANKLNRYKNLKEFKPYFDLADIFGVVVSYTEYSTDWGKRQIFHDLLQKFGMDSFDEICFTLEMDPDNVVDRMCASDDFIDKFSDVIEKIEPYLRYTNVTVFVHYLKESALELLGKKPIDELLCGYLSGLEKSLLNMEGEHMPSVAEHMRLTQCIIECGFDEAKKAELFNQLLNRSQEIYKLYPLKAMELEKEDFIKLLLSDDRHEFAKAVGQFSVMPKEVLVTYLKDALPRIPGVAYPLLQLVYQTIGGNGEELELEMSALNILYQITDHSIDFHALMAQPMDTIKKNITLKNVDGVMELVPVFKLDCDEILLHLIVEKMNARHFDDYARFVAKLKRAESVKPLLRVLIPRLSNADQIKFLNSMVRFDMKRTNETIFDLMRHGLGQFIKDEFIDDPKHLVSTIYNTATVQERLGLKVHKLAKGIAARFGIDLQELQKELVLASFEAKGCVEEITNYSVFNNIQCTCELQSALFILLKWKKEAAIEFLNSIIASPDANLHQKSMATSCLPILGGDPPDVGCVPSFYWTTYEHRHGEPKDRSEAFFLSLADEADPVLAERMLAYVINNRIHNEDLILKLLNILKTNHMRYILRNIARMFKQIPVASNEAIFRLFLEAVASPFSEMMNSDVWKPFKGRQLDVLRDTFCAVSQSPRPIRYLIVNGKECGWRELAEKLCDIGAHVIIAELGAHLVELSNRQAVLRAIMKAGHFDDALEYGFDKNEVFQFILEGYIEPATEVMIDSHFVTFTLWLKAKQLGEALERVKEALKHQGRTMELKRLEERLKA